MKIVHKTLNEFNPSPQKPLRWQRNRLRI